MKITNDNPLAGTGLQPDDAEITAICLIVQLAFCPGSLGLEHIDRVALGRMVKSLYFDLEQQRSLLLGCEHE